MWVADASQTWEINTIKTVFLSEVSLTWSLTFSLASLSLIDNCEKDSTNSAVSATLGSNGCLVINSDMRNFSRPAKFNSSWLVSAGNTFGLKTLFFFAAVVDDVSIGHAISAHTAHSKVINPETYNNSSKSVPHTILFKQLKGQGKNNKHLPTIYNLCRP